MNQDNYYNTGRTRHVGTTSCGGEERTRGADYAPPSTRHSSLPSASPRGTRSVSGGGGVAGGRKKPGKRPPSDWRVAGGPGRDHSVLMELELDKVFTD